VRVVAISLSLTQKNQMMMMMGQLMADQALMMTMMRQQTTTHRRITYAAGETRTLAGGFWFPSIVIFFVNDAITYL
jgi:hypothetical protein